jgi:hypothetical protein
MATYTITSKQLTANYGVVATLEPNEIVTGQSFTISGLTGFNGTYVAVDLPQYEFTGTNTPGDLVFNPSVLLPNQVLFALTGSDIERTTATGTITYSLTCTWATKADVEDWLGFTTTVPSSDNDLLVIAVAAANAYAYRKRQEAGYFDKSLSVPPSQDVLLGTMMYAGALYRERGSIDQYASFDPLATGTPTGGSMGQIMRLLGVNRPAVA